MSKSTAQPLTVSLGVEQTIDIQPATNNSSAQQLTVTLGTDQIVVTINPAQKLPQE